MAALTDNRDTRERVNRLYEPYILDEEIMFAGGMGAKNRSTGKCEMASDKADLVVYGRVEGKVDNSEGGLRAKIKAGVFKWANSSSNPVTNSHLKQVCYVEDDQTVSSDPGTNGVIAGAVVAVDSDGVWVDTTNNVPAVPSAGAVSDPAACDDMTQNTITDNGNGTADQTVEDVADIALSTSDTYSDSAVNIAVNTALASIRNNFKEMTTEFALIKADTAALKTAADENNTAIDSTIDNLQAANLMKTS